MEVMENGNIARLIEESSNTSVYLLFTVEAMFVIYRKLIRKNKTYENYLFLAEVRSKPTTLVGNTQR